MARMAGTDCAVVCSLIDTRTEEWEKGASEGWHILNKYYQPQAAAEKSKLMQQYHSFRMEANENPQSYIGRFVVLRSRLAFYGPFFSAADNHHRLLGNLSPAFRLQKSIHLTQSDFAMQVVKKVATSAYGEIEIERYEDARNGTGYAFVASGTGRGGGGGLNGGRESGG